MESSWPMDMRRHPDEPPGRKQGRGLEAAAGLMASLGLHLLAAAVVLGSAHAERADPLARAIEIGLVAPARVAATTQARPAPRAPAVPTKPRAASVRSDSRSTLPPAIGSRAVAGPPAKPPPDALPPAAAPGPPLKFPSENTAAAIPASASTPGTPSPGRAAGPVEEGPASTGAFGVEAAPMFPATGAGSATAVLGSIPEAIQRGVAYPPLARKMGWEGRVLISFRILPDGSVRDVRVVQGSGHAILDRSAVEAVRSASPFPRPRETTEIRTPVVYKLY